MRRIRGSKADQFTESVIREMTRLAVKHGAINLAQGYPDFPAPGVLKSAACDAIKAEYNQYAITWGDPELRAALSEKVLAYNGMDFDPDHEVTVTCGSTEAMIASLLAHIDPGDEVVIIEPFYENYGPDTIISGAVPRYVHVLKDFTLNEESLKAAFSSRTKGIILNTPNNPTGHVFSIDELRLIRDLCNQYDTIAFVDEIYEHILYDGHSHISLGSLDGIADRTVTIGSFSKTYSVTGWRVGYALADAALTGPIRKMHDFLTVGAPAPLQRACITALQMPEAYYQDLAASYDKKRKILFSGLCKAGFSCRLPEGAYYILADIGRFGMDDQEFARHLVEHAGVAAVPGSSFYRDGGKDLLRFTFSKRDETLEEACMRLSAFFESR